MFQQIKGLFVNLTVFGLADVATSLVSFLLLPVYVRYLTPADYGVLALLLSIEVIAKIVFRWGIDASFMRMYFDCPDQPAQQKLASTLFWFLAAVNGGALLIALAASPFIAEPLFGTRGHTAALQVTLVNSFLGGFFFIPFHVLRIVGKTRQFSALTFARSASTLALRLVLVVFAGLGVLGVQAADLVITIVFTAVLARWFTPLIRAQFSRAILIEALQFGLPRVPHGLAQQLMSVADRYLLRLFLPLSDVGVYAIGASFGAAIKLFLSAFEYAWAPFYFGAMREPHAKMLYSSVTTYAVAALALLCAGASAIAWDVVRLMTKPEFYEAARVIPWIALGITLQGVYLLTSIGLNITKRTVYYPAATAVAAATSIGANLILIPRYGLVAAAWSNVLAYAVQAGVAMRLSQRVYPMTYEWGRLARIVTAALLAYIGGVRLPLGDPSPLVGVLARGSVVVMVFIGGLALTGFLTASERARVRALLGRAGPVVSRSSPA